MLDKQSGDGRGFGAFGGKGKGNGSVDSPPPEEIDALPRAAIMNKS